MNELYGIGEVADRAEKITKTLSEEADSDPRGVSFYEA